MSEVKQIELEQAGLKQAELELGRLKQKGLKQEELKQKELKQKVKVVQRSGILLIILTFFSMLGLYFYFSTGGILSNNLQSSFEEREDARYQLELLELSLEKKGFSFEKSSEYQKQKLQLLALGQKLDIHHELLIDWNRIWLFGNDFNGKLSHYDYYKHGYDFKLLNQKRRQLLSQGISTDKLKVREVLNTIQINERNKKWDKARRKIFLNIQGANLVLEAIQIFFLPFLTSLLGATLFMTVFTFKKALTSSYTLELANRLFWRLPIAAFGGVTLQYFAFVNATDFLKTSSLIFISLFGGAAATQTRSYNFRLLKKQPLHIALSLLALTGSISGYFLFLETEALSTIFSLLSFFLIGYSIVIFIFLFVFQFKKVRIEQKYFVFFGGIALGSFSFSYTVSASGALTLVSSLVLAFLFGFSTDGIITRMDKFLGKE